MCEIFYIEQTTEGNLKEVFKQLLEASERNNDGFGWFSNKTAFKSPRKLVSKDLDRFLNLAGHKFVVAHVRYSTSGKNNIENTHPFLSKHYGFVHNGVLSGGNKKFSDSYNTFQELLNYSGSDLEKIKNVMKEKSGSYSCFFYNKVNAKLFYFRNTCNFHFCYIKGKGIFGATDLSKLKALFSKTTCGVFTIKRKVFVYEPEAREIYLVQNKKIESLGEIPYVTTSTSGITTSVWGNYHNQDWFKVDRAKDITGKEWDSDRKW